jgi:hypothetical protein
MEGAAALFVEFASRQPKRRTPMIRSLAILACLGAALPAGSQAPTRPQIETRKVDGTDR